MLAPSLFFFFFNDTATTEIYPLSLHDALPICRVATRMIPPMAANKRAPPASQRVLPFLQYSSSGAGDLSMRRIAQERQDPLDRKSTRLNSSHQIISYAVFCLKKKN